MSLRLLIVPLLLALTVAARAAAPYVPDTGRGDALLREYFRAETQRLSDRCLADVKTLPDWTSRRDTHRRQLEEMLGLSPMPERTPLNAVTTGRTDHPELTVERVRFESRPGLYVTGNLYLPKGQARPAPAILYLCGHSNVKKEGVSYGAKAHYQHHGAWYARNGYACLMIDTLQLGEIEGLHHGTYREGMWWWNGRGYTPAGVEAWNGIRGLDYLQSRPEVDGQRIGVTGRSGGGAYAWYVTALDDRVKAAVPTAGITDLRNHVVDGCVEGHCDCMYMVNTYGWDYPQLAALAAPRPLMIQNSDKDSIFPLDGVERLHAKVREIYRLYGAEKNLALTITDGPHEDTQELQVPMLRWFNRHLKGENPLLETVARPLFRPEQLRVLTSIPADQKNTAVHETFVPPAPAPRVPKDSADWARQREGWMKALREKSFGGWPAEGAPLHVTRVRAALDASGVSAYDFTSQENVPLRLYYLSAQTKARPDGVVLRVLDEPGWRQLAAGLRGNHPALFRGAPEAPEDPKALAELLRKHAAAGTNAYAFLAPRGIGPTAWSGSPQQKVHIRRRFMLLGQTLDGMRAWDIRRAIQALRSINPALPVRLEADGEMAGPTLYASLFEPQAAALDLNGLPPHGKEGPDLLNVLRFMDTPQALALAAERCPVRVDAAAAEACEYAKRVWGKSRVRAD